MLHRNISIVKQPAVKYRLFGQVYGRQGFKNGEYIITSPVVENNGSEVMTRSGSKYKLGKMHPDYKELLTVVEIGTPIIQYWKLLGDKKAGYLLEGIIKQGERNCKIEKKVIKQDGNNVILDDNKTYLVNWSSWGVDDIDVLSFEITGMYRDIPIREFEEYLGFKQFKPNLNLG